MFFLTTHTHKSLFIMFHSFKLDININIDWKINEAWPFGAMVCIATLRLDGSRWDRLEFFCAKFKSFIHPYGFLPQSKELSTKVNWLL